MRGKDKIDYRYLNMDTQKFVESDVELVKQSSPGSLKREVPNFLHGQILIASGREPFTETQAIMLCRRISFKEGATE